MINYGIGIECEFPVYLHIGENTDGTRKYLPVSNLFDVVIKKKYSSDVRELFVKLSNIYANHEIDTTNLFKGTNKLIRGISDLFYDGDKNESRLVHLENLYKLKKILQDKTIKINKMFCDYIELIRETNAETKNINIPKIDTYDGYRFGQHIKNNLNKFNSLLNLAFNAQYDFSAIILELSDDQTIFPWGSEQQKLYEIIRKEYKDYDCNNIVIDIEDINDCSSRFEIKSCNPKKSISDSIYEMEQLKRCCEMFILSIFPKDIHEHFVFNHEYSTYPYVACQDGVVQETKCGSYHLNLTLPYNNSDISNDNFFTEFNKTHINWGKMIQTLEPIFLAVLSNSSYESFYGGEHSIKNSRRLINANNRNLNFMVKDLDDMYPKNINEEVNLDQQRYGHRPHQWRFLGYTMYQLFKEQFGDIDDDEIMDMIDFLQGTDFRVNERFYKPSQNKYFGFEFRFLDLFPLEHLKTVTQFLFMLAEYVKNESITVENPLFIFDEEENYPKFGDMLHSIIKNGWKDKPANIYIDLLNKYKFGIDYNVKNYYDLIKHIHEFLKGKCNNYKKNNKLSYFQYVDNVNDFHKDIKDFPNINKLSYNMFMELKTGDLKDKLYGISETCKEQKTEDCVQKELHGIFPKLNSNDKYVIDNDTENIYAYMKDLGIM